MCSSAVRRRRGAEAPVFAVLDGAQFDNLPRALAEGGFVSKPLYLERSHHRAEQMLTAPHMVWLDERDADGAAQAEPEQAGPEQAGPDPAGRAPNDTLHALLALIGDQPAAVFWQCPSGGAALYKHLRGINKVLIPDERPGALDQQADPPEQTDGATEADTNIEIGTVADPHEMVLFRHADANALAQTLFVMDVAEAARMFGPASTILCAPEPEWTNGRPWLTARANPDWPKPKAGPLRLTQDTMERVTQRRVLRRQQTIIAYLEKVTPRITTTKTRAELTRLVQTHIAEAEAHGVRSDAALGRWCYLQLLTNGEIGRQKEVVDYLREAVPTRPADQRVQDIMHMAIYRLGET